MAAILIFKCTKGAGVGDYTSTGRGAKEPLGLVLSYIILCSGSNVIFFLALLTRRKVRFFCSLEVSINYLCKQQTLAPEMK